MIMKEKYIVMMQVTDRYQAHMLGDEFEETHDYPIVIFDDYQKAKAFADLYSRPHEVEDTGYDYYEKGFLWVKSVPYCDDFESMSASDKEQFLKDHDIID